MANCLVMNVVIVLFVLAYISYGQNFIRILGNMLKIALIGLLEATLCRTRAYYTGFPLFSLNSHCRLSSEDRSF